MIKLVLMPDASEIVPYDNPVLPLHISLGELNAFPERKMLCHWHDDIELISVISSPALR